MKSIKYNILYFPLLRGKNKGMVKFNNITLNDIIKIFFPKNFYEKFIYLGCVPNDNDFFVL